MDGNNLPLPSSSTLVLRPQVSDGQVVHLKLKKPKNNHKQVRWDVHAIDNENLNKKKSKCCCIYKKPEKFGDPADGNESNESDNDECDSCMGKKKTHKLHRNNSQKEEQNEEPKEDN